MIEHIVLDLDHTLIHSIERIPKNQPLINQMKRLFRHHETEDYVVFERPGLQQFIALASANYKLSVWTAASRYYGQYIIDHVITPYMTSNKKIFLYLSDVNCATSLRITGVLKHLDLLYLMKEHNYPFTRDNTVIIDDNHGILAQNSYVFNIKEFDFDPADDELSLILRKIQNIQ